MIDINIQVDDLQARVALGLLAKRFADYGPVLHGSVLPILREMEGENFRGKGALSTPPWAPLSRATLAKRGPRIGMLRVTDRLHTSLTAAKGTDAVRAVTPTTVTFGTTTKYASFHQRGTKWMPQRQVIPDPLPNQYLSRITYAIRGWVLYGAAREGAMP